MEAKNVKNNIVLMLFIIVWCTCSHAQEKYLLFDAKKDSIVQLDGISYYKIDKNLFDIDRYSEIDTINLDQSKNIVPSSVSSLRKMGNSITDSIMRNLKKNEPIIIEKIGIETNNDLFKYIYILERIDNCEYKRTRVWWIDY